MNTPKYHYEVNPRDPALGGGWRLGCFIDGEEVQGGAYPAESCIDDAEAYSMALASGEEWLDSETHN